jgi:hypothetical protein
MHTSEQSEHTCGYGNDAKVRCFDCFRAARAVPSVEEPTAQAEYAPLNSPFTMLGADDARRLNGRQVEHRERMLRHLQAMSAR